LTRSATAMVTRPFPCSVWGLQGAKIGGGSKSDSFDSSVASYNSALPGPDGNICSCKNITLVGSPTLIDGKVYYGSGFGLSATGQAHATGGSDVLPTCINPSIDMSAAATHNDNASVGLASGAALNLLAHAAFTL